ncbi:MAG: T9SS type A sorting domain-containing protein [Bacteroidales bacterium]|jgi:hypothetical protein|nr:T9SS type A sorting domain-containing protein [Bacteroidales bacterium]
MNNQQTDNQNLAARLAGYTAAAGAMLALNPSVNAQVAYSGIKDIEVDIGDYHLLDMDRDGELDFVFVIDADGYFATSGPSFIYKYVNEGYGVIINPLTDGYNSWLVKTTYLSDFATSYPVVNGLNSNAPVSSGQTYWWAENSPDWAGALGYKDGWYYWGSTYGTISGGIQGGDFIGETRYIGVRFHIGTDIHYGWIRASLGDFIQPLEIVDWAYNTVPDEGIFTGFDIPVFENDEFYTALVNEIGLSFNHPVQAPSPADFEVENGSVTGVSVVTAGEEYLVEVTADEEGIIKVTLPPFVVVGEEMVVGGAETQFVVHNVQTDIADIEADEQLKLYPNPADDLLTIELASESYISIFNSAGSIVYSKDKVLNKTIDVHNFAPGIYLIQVNTNNNQFITKQFVKQ